MRPLERLFDSYGRFLARHPLPFFIVPIIVTLACLSGLYNFHSQDDIWDIYSPLNGLCRKEEKALERFEYASSAHHYRIQVLVWRKDGGNLMNDGDVGEISAMHRFVTENVTVSDGVHVYAYKDICGIYRNESNALVLAFVQAILDMKNRQSSSLMLTYPNAQALQRHLFVGYSLGDLHWSRHDPSVVDGFKLFVLHFMVNLNLPNGRQVARDFELQLRALFRSATKESKNLNFAILSRDRELEEQRKITLVALPFLGVTALVLTCFMVVTLVDFPLHKSQHIEAVIGVVSPGMALISSMGFLWLLGFPFSNILTVVPFLVVTIGIDDAFLILAGWRHSAASADLETRMGMAMAKSGASVTVTSITDILCFAVGLVSNLPVVQLFCLYTSVALTVDFIYQITFFSAVVVYCGRRQITYEKQLRYDSSVGMSKSKNFMSRIAGKLREVSDTLCQLGSIPKFSKDVPGVVVEKDVPRKDADSAICGSGLRREPLLRFVDFLHNPVTRIVVMLISVAHIGASTYLCTQVNTDFDMENLYLKDSPLNAISRKMQSFVLSEAFVVNFALYPMPNFADRFVRDKFNRMVEQLETIPKFSRGPLGTNLWTRDFADSIAFWGEENDFWKQNELLKYFREYSMEEKYITTDTKSDGTEVISGFFWSITYHGMESFLEVEDLMEQRRAIIAKYAEFFNVSSHHPLEKVPTESAASAPFNFVQTAVSAVVLMSILVFLFVLDLGAIISVVVSILSICAGTVGYLHLWDVRLDAVSLISMLMSIGFSVDYSAHICYHFFTHNKMTDDSDSTSGTSRTISIIVGNETNARPPRTALDALDAREADKGDQGEDGCTRSRLEATFKGVGWPVIQSGLSTAIGMVPLIMVRAYVVAVFWKTVLLVTFLGLFHALFLLPVVFLLFADCSRIFRRILR